MGFMPEIQKMVEDPNMPKKAPEGERQTLMFSATFPDEVQESAQEFLAEDYLFLTIGMVGGACSDVKQVKIILHSGAERSPGQTKYIIGGSYIVGNVCTVRFRNS